MLGAIIFFVLAALDRFSKIISLVRPEHVTVPSWLNSVVEFYPSTNSGGVLGIFFPLPLLIYTTMAVGFFFLWLAFHERVRGSRFALLLVALGIFSNGYDRVVYGHVIDSFRAWHSLSFNLADLYIVGGLLLIIVSWQFGSTIAHPEKVV